MKRSSKAEHVCERICDFVKSKTRELYTFFKLFPSYKYALCEWKKGHWMERISDLDVFDII